MEKNKKRKPKLIYSFTQHPTISAKPIEVDRTKTEVPEAGERKWYSLNTYNNRK